MSTGLGSPIAAALTAARPLKAKQVGMAQFPEAFAADVPDPAALLQLRILGTYG